MGVGGGGEDKSPLVSPRNGERGGDSFRNPEREALHRFLVVLTRDF